MEGRLIGRDPRILIVDGLDDWHSLGSIEPLDFGGQPIWIGIDLAPEAELPSLNSPPVPVQAERPLPGVKRSHPTTAGELRRAERRRRR